MSVQQTVFKMRLTTKFVLLFLTAAIIPSRALSCVCNICPEGWTWIPSGRCVTVEPASLKWEEARQSCVSRSLPETPVALVTLETTAKHDQIVNFLAENGAEQPVWINGVYNNDSSSVSWFRDLHYGRVKTQRVDADVSTLAGCVYLQDNKWSTANCEESKRSLCEFIPGSYGSIQAMTTVSNTGDSDTVAATTESVVVENSD